MLRFPHYLRKTNGGKWPRSIMTLDATGKNSELPSSNGMYAETLDGWSAAILESANGGYEIAHIASGKGNVGLWSALERAANDLAPLWVFSYRACRVWNLLNLWEGIENGRIIIAERASKTTVSECILRSVRTPDSTIGTRAVSAGSLSRLLADANGYMVSGDPPNILRCRFALSRQWITWVDVRNYGIERSENTASGRDTSLWLASCVRSISDALHTYKLGSLRPTAGSQAMHGFRSSYYKGGIYVGTGRKTTALESAGYYGGRCECRAIGTIGSIVYGGDYSAQYCRCCRDQMLPVRCITHKFAETVQGSSPVCCVSESIARVDIDTDEAAYPYRRTANPDLRRATKTDSAVILDRSCDTDIIYPIGRFTTTLCGPELQDAVDNGRVKRWHEWATYEMQPALREYAEAILKMRSEAERLGDSVAMQLAKRLGNSLPGKFGERRKDWIYSPEASCDIQYGEWYSPNKQGVLQRYRAIAGVVHRESLPEYSADAVPSIAAWVTSLGRMVLLNAIRAAGWNNVYYYDTDSIFVNAVGWKRLQLTRNYDPDNGPLLRNVGTETDTQFLGIKHYHFGYRYVCAGESRKLLRMPDGSYAYARSLTPIESVRAGERPEQNDILVRDCKDAPYKHGIVGSDGRVSPIELQEW